MIPKRCNVRNQEGFTVTVSKEQAQNIQAALNHMFKLGKYDKDEVEMLTAQEYVQSYLLDDADAVIQLRDPYDR